jgi:EcoRII C terminal
LISELPRAWRKQFPHGQELTDEAAKRAGSNTQVDRRLVTRYRCEFSLFKVVEEAHTLPLVRDGFKNVDQFLAVAQATAQRRKARAGRALELQLKKIFDEEHVQYSFHAPTEMGRIPDFVFPSIARYDAAPKAGSKDLRILAVKTTLKDRWRQVLDEAAKVPQKHLLTIAEGVSINQYKQMVEGGIKLVIPAENHRKFPKEIRPDLLKLAGFIQLLKQ